MKSQKAKLMTTSFQSEYLSLGEPQKKDEDTNIDHLNEFSRLDLC